MELRGFNGHVDRRLSEEYKDRELGRRIKTVENSRLPNKSEIVLFCVSIIYHFVNIKPSRHLNSKINFHVLHHRAAKIFSGAVDRIVLF